MSRDCGVCALVFCSVGVGVRELLNDRAMTQIEVDHIVDEIEQLP